MRTHLFAVALVGAALQGCGLTPAIQPQNDFYLTKTDNSGSQTALERLQQRRQSAQACSDEDLGTTTGFTTECRAKVRVFIETAVTLSDESCDKWFDGLVGSDVQTTYAKNWVNIIGNTTQAVMGLNGSSPDSIAKVAIALGLTNAGFDNYRAVYLMSSTLHKVRATIKTGRTAAATAMRANIDEYASWDDANEDVKSYHRSCSREAIQDILDAGVSATAYVLPDLSGAAAEYKAANQKLYQAIFGSAGEFSDADVKQLTDNQDKILAAAAPADEGLPKTANAKFNTLDAKGKADFRRSLETLKRIQDERERKKTTVANLNKQAKDIAVANAATSLQFALTAERQALLARQNESTAEINLAFEQRAYDEADGDDEKEKAGARLDIAKNEFSKAQREARLAQGRATEARRAVGNAMVMPSPTQVADKRQVILLKPVVDPSRLLTQGAR